MAGRPPLTPPSPPPATGPGNGAPDGPIPTSEEPTFSTSGGLHARRGRQRPSLSLEAIVEGSSDSIPRRENEVHARFKGFVDPTAPTEEVSAASLKSLPPAALSVMSYNILATRYVTTDKYRHCPTWALAEPYRAMNIISEISGANPDIICFQEISSEMHRAHYFGQRLRSVEFNYDSFHLPISDKTGQSHAAATSGSGVASSMSSNGSYTNESATTSHARAVHASRRSGQSDAAAANSSERTSDAGGGGGIPISENVARPEFEGVAIFFRKNRFEVQEHLPIKFNIIAARDSNLEIGEKSRLAIKSHNVGVVSVLKDLRTNDILIVACTHAYWDWTRPECQLWQMITLLKELEDLNATYKDLGFRTHVVFGADLNCEPHSVPLRYALEGNVHPSVHAQCFPKYRDATHGLRLQNTYQDYLQRCTGGEVSSYCPTHQGVIDHILCSKSLEVVAVGRLGKPIDMPAVDIPSDHYPVSVVLIPGAPE